MGALDGLLDRRPRFSLSCSRSLGGRWVVLSAIVSRSGVAMLFGVAALVIVAVVLVLLALELLLWGALLLVLGVVGLILHEAGVLETVSQTLATLAALAVLVWVGIRAVKAYGLPMWAQYYFSPAPENNLSADENPPKNAQERYLWANRLGRYSDE